MLVVVYDKKGKHHLNKKRAFEPFCPEDD